ncbi:MAG: MBL fold metallo-hydrolase RNA specificity domain-containing protein, partial [Dehalococcoidia bacterium]
EDQLEEIVNDTVARGGNVVIPSFAVERTQEVLLHLRRLTEAGRIPPLVTFLDSPMGTAVTRLFRRYAALLDPDVAAGFGRHRSPFEYPTLHIVDTPDASKAINGVRGSVIIIAGAGMCNGGRVVHHLAHNLGRPESTVAMVGYQATGTLGRDLLDGHDVVYLFGEPHPVRARIAEVAALSAHADRDELCAWLERLPNRPERVLLVHGEENASRALRDHLAARTGWDVSVPAYGDVIALGE